MAEYTKLTQDEKDDIDYMAEAGVIVTYRVRQLDSAPIDPPPVDGPRWVWVPGKIARTYREHTDGTLAQQPQNKSFHRGDKFIVSDEPVVYVSDVGKQLFSQVLLWADQEELVGLWVREVDIEKARA